MRINTKLNTIKEPFVNVDYYKESINKPFLRSFGILSSVIFIMAFLSSAKFTKNEVPKFVTTTQNTITEFSENYPENLTFDWNGEKLLSNTESISVSWPSSFDNRFNESYPEVQKVPNQFLYFNNSDKNPDELNISTSEYMIVVNSSNMYHIDDRNPDAWIEQSINTVLQEDTPQNINKDSVTFFSNEVMSLLSSNLNTIKLAFFAVFSILFYFSKFWFLIFETILVIVLFKLYSLKLSAKQTLLLTTHVMIPTVVLNTVAELLYGNINLPLQTLTFWILIMFISFQLRKDIKKV